MKDSRKPVVIKKYENRRLYNTADSRYVNLDEVAQMVRNGQEVQVVDAASGEDLTRPVLTQIIMDQAKEPESAFPLDVLRQMVVASGKATQENTLKYMKAVLEMYQNAFRAIAPPLSPFEFIAKAPASPAPATDFHPPAEAVSEPPSRKPDSAEVVEMKRRLGELESLVSKLGGRKPARKPKGKRSRRS